MSGPCKNTQHCSVECEGMSAVLRVGMFMLALMRRIGGFGRQWCHVHSLGGILMFIFCIYKWNMWMCSTNCKATLIVTSSEFEMLNLQALTYSFVKQVFPLNSPVHEIHYEHRVRDGWRRLISQLDVCHLFSLTEHSFIQPSIKVAHGDVRASIVCALWCLISLDWSTY